MMKGNKLIFILLLAFMVFIQPNSISANLEPVYKPIGQFSLNPWVDADTIKYNIDETYTIRQSLVRYETEIESINLSGEYNFKIFLPREDFLKIFDIKIYKNENLIKQIDYLTGCCEDFNITISVGDTVKLDYFVGNKSIDIINPFFYPFDKYGIQHSYLPVKDAYSRTIKFKIPNTYDLIQNSTNFRCDTYKKHEFTLKNNARIIMPSDLIVNSVEYSSIYDKEDLILVFRTLYASQIGLDYKTSEFPAETSIDKNTEVPCYVHFQYQRPNIIKWIFYISAFFLLILPFIILYSKTNNKIEKLFSSSFIIWSFQEVLNELNPIIRPTRLTIFDLTIFLPLIAIVYYYRLSIFNKVSKIINFLYNFIKIILIILAKFVKFFFDKFLNLLKFLSKKFRKKN